MHGTFTLTIELGNEACQSAQDVASLLETVAQRLRATETMHGRIRDLNGNTVGEFETEEETP